MKTARFLLTLFLAALLLVGLVGCGQKSAPASSGMATAPSSEGPAQSSPSDPEPDPEPTVPTRSPRDADLRFTGSPVCSVAETDTAFVGISQFSEYIMYFDKETGESGVLCGRPECTQSSDSCNGYMNNLARGLAFYDGKLYWLGTGRRPENKDLAYGFWRMDPDGTNRELVKMLPGEIAGTASS